MITIDFHGWRFEEALNEVARIIGEVRLAGSTEEVKFITGHGVLKYAIRDELRTYGLMTPTDISSPYMMVNVE